MKKLVLSLLVALCAIWLQADAATRFVAAPSGLNMRANDNPGSAKLMTVPYGAKVDFIREGSGNVLTIDGLKGKMVLVNYQGQDGYMFGGYLTEIPPAKKPNELGQYAEQVRNEQLEVLYEVHRLDYGGYISDGEAIHIYSHDWQQAWLLARSMAEIPEALQFPVYSGQKESTVKNPDASETAWSDELTAAFTPAGELEDLQYYWRGEGSGWSVHISKSEVVNGLKIAVTFIAD